MPIIKKEGYIIGILLEEEDVGEFFAEAQKMDNEAYLDLLEPGERIRCELPRANAEKALQILLEEGVRVRLIESRFQKGFSAIVQESLPTDFVAEDI